MNLTNKTKSNNFDAGKRLHMIKADAKKMLSIKLKGPGDIQVIWAWLIPIQSLFFSCWRRKILEFGKAYLSFYSYFKQ
jgi:hypothetical protein